MHIRSISNSGLPFAGPRVSENMSDEIKQSTEREQCSKLV
jgi:hypothetical protein